MPKSKKEQFLETHIMSKYDEGILSNYFANNLIKIVDEYYDTNEIIVRVTNLSETPKGFKLRESDLKEYLFEKIDLAYAKKEKPNWKLELRSMNYYERVNDVEKRKLKWNKLEEMNENIMQRNQNEVTELCEDGDCTGNVGEKWYHMSKFDILTFSLFKD